MARLNQILAVEKGAREAAATASRTATDALAKTGPLTGITRTYNPKHEDGDRLPDERTLVQYSVADVFDELTGPLARLWDVTATKDETNRTAVADVVVDGDVLLEAVPATFLVWFEKQLDQVRRIVAAAPVLDPAEIWHDQADGVFRSDPSNTARTKKVPKTVVLYEATPEHPAQVQAFTEDVVEGEWTTTKFSGALPSSEKRAALNRIDRLADAVKVARESANASEVVDRSDIGSAVVDYVFG